MISLMQEWYSISYSVFLGLSGIFFTLFTVIYALIDNKKTTVNFLTDLRKQGLASPRQKADWKYWTKFISTLRNFNGHVLALFVISIIMSAIFIVLHLLKIEESWLTILLVIFEVSTIIYSAYAFILSIWLYHKNMED